MIAFNKIVMLKNIFEIENLLVYSNFKGDSSFRIFWNVFDSENGIQKCHFNSSQNCKIDR